MYCHKDLYVTVSCACVQPAKEKESMTFRRDEILPQMYVCSQLLGDNGN